MPFVLGPDLATGVAQAADLGYDAFELFPPTIDAIDTKAISELTEKHNIKLSTIGTGGGWVSQKLTLTNSDPDARKKGLDFARNMIQVAGDLGATAIIGSMQGRADSNDRDETLKRLGDALAELGEHAKKWDQPVFYEPLNRYETDLANTLEDAAAVLKNSGADNSYLLADLFHMNIEESCVTTSLRNVADHIGHVHFIDSNRWPAGNGHTDFRAIVTTLKEIGFDKYLAVEAYPLPDQLAAAQCAMESFKKLGVC
jgi:sugar phosphate isomerase/epimerase